MIGYRTNAYAPFCGSAGRRPVLSRPVARAASQRTKPPRPVGWGWRFDGDGVDAMPLHLQYDVAGERRWFAATVEELGAHLRARPSFAEQIAPALLRQVLAGHDGELFALLAERRRLEREGWDGAAWCYTNQAALDHNLRRICEEPVATLAGAFEKLKLVQIGATRAENFPHETLRGLTTAAMLWMVALMKTGAAGAPLAIDRAATAAELRGERARWVGDGADANKAAPEDPDRA